MLSIQGSPFYSITYRQKRDSILIPNVLTSEWVKIEIEVFTPPRAPNWYRAGWLNQVYKVEGKPHLLPGLVVPLAPSIFRFSAEHPYQLRFNPVSYLPSCKVKFYRSL